jgi:hypothetical protein
MPTTMSLRIPAWLAGSTVALLIATAVRVGLAGIGELTQLLLLVALSASAFVIAERYEAHLADIYLWPSRKLRNLLYLALLVGLDCYLASIFMLGRGLVDVVGI